MIMGFFFLCIEILVFIFYKYLICDVYNYNYVFKEVIVWYIFSFKLDLLIFKYRGF